MNVCRICGFRNPDQNVRCFRCSGLLRDDEESLRDAERRAGEATESGARIALAGAAESLRRRIACWGLWRIPEDVSFRFPFTAGGLSVVPGLGQLYNHQPGKAALCAIGWCAAVAAALATLRQPYSNALLLGVLLIWMLIWSDAIGTATRINGQHWSLRQSIAVWCWLLFMAGIVITAAQFLLPTLVLATALAWVGAITAMTAVERDHWLGRERALLVVCAILLAAVTGLAAFTKSSRVFTFVRVIDPVHAPKICLGDLVFVNNVAYWFSEPKRGEMVRFDPPRFSAERHGDLYPIDIKDYFQRVIGLPGDRIVKRNGQLLCNGQPIPPQFEPISGTAIPDGEYLVPAGRYFVPVTSIPTDILVFISGGTPPRDVSVPGWIFQNWAESAMVPREAIWGRASAILSPPERRESLN